MSLCYLNFCPCSFPHTQGLAGLLCYQGSRAAAGAALSHYVQAINTSCLKPVKKELPQGVATHISVAM